MSDLNDYLFLEELFIKRIHKEVSNLADVKGLPDLAALEDQTPATPSVYVIYLGDAPVPGAAGHGGLKTSQMVKQYWAFVLSIQTADAANNGEAARREAGPLLGQMLLALQGWQPAADVDALVRAERPVPASYSNGYFYYPLVFTTTFIFPRQKPWQLPT